jgi:hypothetical protein
MATYTGVIGCGDVVIICLLVVQIFIMLTTLHLAYTEAE